MPDKDTDFTEALERLALDFVMADRAGTGALDLLAGGFRLLAKLADGLSAGKKEKARNAALAAAEIAEKFMRDGRGGPADLLLIEKYIIAMQMLAGAGLSAEEVALPGERGNEPACADIACALNELQEVLRRISRIADAGGDDALSAAADEAAGLVKSSVENKLQGHSGIKNAVEHLIKNINPMPDSGAPPNTGPMTADNDRSDARECAGQYALTGDTALLKDFINEANEHIESADSMLLVLEKDGDNHEAVNTVFRCFHTLKSLSGFLELHDIFALVREAEAMLHKIRKKEIPVNAACMDALFGSVDMLKKQVKNLKQALLSGKKMRIESGLDEVLAGLRGICGDAKTGGTPLTQETAAADVMQGRPGVTHLNEFPKAQKPGFPCAPPAMIKETVKIDTEKLDRLIDTIGEIVIAESMINSDNSAMLLASNDYFKNIGHLNKTTKRLHELGLALRLVPLAPVMQKMERIVRDLAKIHNKKINFTVSGEETEIDRSIVEKIQDPLVHMLRNAVDHGLENSAQERRAAGKPETAGIMINAFHRGGNVVIEVSDDGRGLDRKKILARGMESGLINTESTLSDADIFSLIFRPGFSTASIVTDTSGRGVGMDVVKRNVEELRGRIDIDTHAGKGTKFTVSLPITTAIIEAMVVTVNSDRYLLPTLSIVESIRAESSVLSTVKGRGIMLNLRGRLLPVFCLKSLFYGIRDDEREIFGKIIVIIEDDNKRAGIVVDNLLEQQQIVVKSMSKGIDKTEGIAGCTIMSDGRVGLILDAAEIVKIAMGGNYGIAGEKPAAAAGK